MTQPQVDDIKKLLGKKFTRMQVGDYKEPPRLKTGLINLDRMIGGGIPFGRIIEVFGSSSAGKTSLCMSILKSAQEQGHLCAFVDAERAMNMNDAMARFGVSNELVYFDPSHGEEGIEFILEFIGNGGKVVVADSVPCFTPKQALEADLETAAVAQVARLFSKVQSLLTESAAQNDAVIIFINQLRNKIGGYGNPETTPGGYALQHMMSLRFRLSRKEFLTGDNPGIRTRIQAVKNKVNGGMQECEVDILARTGPDPLSAMTEELQKVNFVTRSGSWFSWAPEIAEFLGRPERIGQGAKAVTELMKENPDLYSILYDRINALSDS